MWHPMAPSCRSMLTFAVARGAWGSPAKILKGPYVTGSPISSRNYDVSADGKRFLMVRQPVNQAAAPQIVVVLDWTEELKRLVPTN